MNIKELYNLIPTTDRTMDYKEFRANVAAIYVPESATDLEKDVLLKAVLGQQEKDATWFLFCTILFFICLASVVFAFLVIKK